MEPVEPAGPVPVVGVTPPVTLTALLGVLEPAWQFRKEQSRRVSSREMTIDPWWRWVGGGYGAPSELGEPGETGRYR